MHYYSGTLPYNFKIVIIVQLLFCELELNEPNAVSMGIYKILAIFSNKGISVIYHKVAFKFISQNNELVTCHSCLRKSFPLNLESLFQQAWENHAT